MKLQGFSIIFALAAIPLLLILSYYIKLQVDTITLQNGYDTKLIDSTYDALVSMEINTANEDLSTVSDSLRTIIEASCNVFFNTLATNMGLSNASKSYIEPYIPAILYTLYDGYYIYAPTQVPNVVTTSDGTAVTVGDAGVNIETDPTNSSYYYTYDESDSTKLTSADISGHQEDYGQLLYKIIDENITDSNPCVANISDERVDMVTKNVLKSYMPYSAEYIQRDNDDPENIIKDLTITYTLDNYVTIEGTINGIYYSESGYLIPNDDTIRVVVNDDENKIFNYNQNDIQDIIESGPSDIVISISGEEIINCNNNGIYRNLNDSKKAYDEEMIQLKNDLSNASNSHQIQTITNNINNLQYRLDKISAAVYYAKAKIFTNWVNQNLNGSDALHESDIQRISGIDYTTENETEYLSNVFDSDQNIFDLEGTDQNNEITEIDRDSPFYNHKLNVIRESIQYNLNLAMTTYNRHVYYGIRQRERDLYAMPVMSSEEWEQILSNISIVSFMQGLDCGLKKYNNYSVISSTNNEIMTSPQDIYYIPNNQFNNENSIFHRIDCPKLVTDANLGSTTDFASFSSKEVKYDKILNIEKQYEYDHKNLACYDCINNGIYNNRNIFVSLDPNYGSYANLRRAYYIGVGKERNNVYKMNGIKNSQGFEIIYDTNIPITDIANNAIRTGTASSSKPLKDIKEIEIVFSPVNTRDANEEVLNFTVPISGYNDPGDSEHVYSIPTNTNEEYTWNVKIDPNISNGPNSCITVNSTGPQFVKLSFRNLNSNSTVITNSDVNDLNQYIKFVRVIYK